jgi:hypothetical protein
MMKYKYKNLKHVKLHGMEPFGEGVFDEPLTGGGIELVEKIHDKKVKKNKMEIGD